MVFLAFDVLPSYAIDQVDQMFVAFLLMERGTDFRRGVRCHRQVARPERTVALPHIVEHPFHFAVVDNTVSVIDVFVTVVSAMVTGGRGKTSAGAGLQTAAQNLDSIGHFRI
jgi:hypothetical protein